MTRRLPPGPPGNFLLGNLLQFRRDPLGFLAACARDYGAVTRYRVAHINVYLLSDPEDIEYVLTNHLDQFSKGRIHQASRVMLGNGLALSEGEFWRRQRRLSQPAFHRERIAAYGQIMIAQAQRLIASWWPGATLDVHKAMMSAAMQTIAETLFGASVASDVEAVETALQVFFEQLRKQMDTGLLVPGRWPTPGNLRLRQAMRRLDAVIYRIIRERREHRGDRDDLLALLLKAQDEAGSQMTDLQLRDEVVTLFVAGYETVAVALAWTWYLLSENPAVDSKLAAELKTVLAGRPPVPADVPQLRYTEKVVKEALRLYPPVWAIPRMAIRSGVAGGYTLPAGTSVTLSPWVTQRDLRYFERPEEFNPDRWTDDFTKQLPKFAFFPFGGGPRLCIGSAFAMIEAVLMLATIAQQFRLTLAPGSRVELWPTIVLRPRHGITMTLHRRD